MFNSIIFPFFYNPPASHTFRPHKRNAGSHLFFNPFLFLVLLLASFNILQPIEGFVFYTVSVTPLYADSFLSSFLLVVLTCCLFLLLLVVASDTVAAFKEKKYLFKWPEQPNFNPFAFLAVILHRAPGNAVLFKKFLCFFSFLRINTKEK